MKRPTIEQMETAIEWLRCNEGEGDEGANCLAVALWLETQVESATLREVAKEGGVSVVALRAAANRKLRDQETAKLRAEVAKYKDREAAVARMWHDPDSQ